MIQKGPDDDDDDDFRFSDASTNEGYLHQNRMLIWLTNETVIIITNPKRPVNIYYTKMYRDTLLSLNTWIYLNDTWMM